MGILRKLFTPFSPDMSDEPPPFIHVTPFGDTMSRLYRNADREGLKYRSLLRRWTSLHYLLGLATSVLAAVAGLGGLGEILGDRKVAWLALAASAVAAMATFLKTDDQRRRCETLVRDWDDLRDEIEIAYMTAPAAEDRLEAARRMRDGVVAEIPADPKDWPENVERFRRKAASLRAGVKIEDRTPISWHREAERPPPAPTSSVS